MSALQPRPGGLDAIADPVADADVAVRQREVVAGICHLRLDAPPGFLAARAGQFALVRSLRPEAPLLPRPLSIVSLDDGLELVFNIVGPGTKAIASVAEGEAVQIVGPLGRPIASPGGELTILTDASHVGTMLALARQRAAESLPTEVVYVASEEREATDDHLAGVFMASGLPVRRIAPRSLDDALRDVRHLAAGASDGVMRRVQALASERGIEGVATLHAVMACGVGACHSCARRCRDGSLRLVCEGPHFDLAAPSFDD